MNKVVIFDWGGVIMRTFDRSGREKWQQRLGIAEPRGLERRIFGSQAWNEAQLGQRSDESYWSAIANDLSLASDELTQMREDFYGGDRLDEDVMSLIRELKAEGCKVGLMSNNSMNLLNVMKDRQLDHMFDEVVISAEIGVMKPAPEAFQAILDKLDVQPADSVFIDDYPVNIDGARAMGMHAIHFVPQMDLQASVREFLNG